MDRTHLELVAAKPHGVGRGDADATEVAIRFTAINERTTRVEIEHRGWEVLGARADAWRDRNYAAWARCSRAIATLLSSVPGRLASHRRRFR
jgi:hypothetical protein